MPNCKVCQKQAASALVFHRDCLMTKFNEICDEFCNEYCKHVAECDNEDTGCYEKCPINGLFDLV